LAEKKLMTGGPDMGIGIGTGNWSGKDNGDCGDAGGSSGRVPEASGAADDWSGVSTGSSLGGSCVSAPDEAVDMEVVSSESGSIPEASSVIISPEFGLSIPSELSLIIVIQETLFKVKIIINVKINLM
jgi:hypothetical protein